MTQAIIYARYSTDLQDETSIDDQFRVCREYAERQGWSVAREYSDAGISGAALGNRPGALAAIDSASFGDVLLVMDLTRLCRSQDLAPLVARLRHRGVRVIGVQDGFDSESRTASMQAGLSGIMSEEFRRMVADRTRSALELRARTGGSTGGKPYDNEEVIKEAFARFAAGETMRSIVSDFNRRGIPSPGANWKPRSDGNSTRGRWLTSSLRAILRNEKYIGKHVWNRSQWVKDPDTGKRIRRERPESEWVVRWTEPLIDMETWEAVQRRFVLRSAPDRRASYILSGLLICGICGSRLVIVGGRGAGTRYGCGANHVGGEHACTNGVTFRRDIAEELILRPTIEEMLSPEAIAEGVKMLREERAKAERAADRGPTEAEREVAELERLVREGLVSADVIAPALAEAKRKVKEQRKTAGVTLGLPWPSEQTWREAVENMRHILQGDDIQAARDVLKRLIREVRCTPAEGYVIAEVQWFHILLATGTAGKGRFSGSGGLLLQNLTIPVSRPGRPPRRRSAPKPSTLKE